MYLENQVGALPDQLNVCLLANVSIISRSDLKRMIDVLFSFKGWTTASRTQSTYADHSVDIMGKP